MAKSGISHIEFPADDVERAKRFWSRRRLKVRTDGRASDYWWFRTGPGPAVASASAACRRERRPRLSRGRSRRAVAAAQANGGTVVTPPSPVPGQGRYAALLDPEGNEIGLFEAAAQAPG
jgi:predicted enzyme related to lactoylglutathione lyase